MGKVLQPGIVGVAGRRHAVFPADIIAQMLAAPVADIERRIGKDEVGLQVFMLIGKKGIAQLNAGINAANSQVHLGQTQGGGVGFLAIDGQVFDIALMLFNKALALDEHTARAAAAVINPAIIRFEHRDQDLDDALRGPELPALLSFGIGELTQEIFIDPAQQVLGLMAVLTEADSADQVDKLAKALFVQFRVGIDLG